MDSSDLDVLKRVRQWLAQGLRCELLTVVRTWGSSPRPAGALMGLCENGAVAGSVSGGCVEDELVHAVREQGMWRQLPVLVTYGISSEQARSFGLPCGGVIELVIEPLSARSRIDDLLARLDGGMLVARHLELASGAVTLARASAGEVQRLGGGVLSTVHGPQWRLFIVGAGQLSRFVAEIASGLDYQVTVCDPREEYDSQWQLTQVALVREMPDDVIASARLDGRSAVVALTHDPKLDDLALIEALASPAFYVGALGSHASNERRRERLRLFDLSPEQIARLRAPIGLYIASRTPGEIAISILAELTAARNGVPPFMLHTHADAPLRPKLGPVIRPAIQ